MDPQQEFVLFLEKHPRFYMVTQSNLYMGIILLLQKQAKSAHQLRKQLPYVSIEDLELILKSLFSLALIEETRAAGICVYYTSSLGAELLEKYLNAKQSFDLG